MEKMNIFQKMLKATETINRVAKNLSVGVGKSAYKATGEADVLAAVKPVEIELGIYSYPFNRKIVDTNVFTTTSEFTDRETGEAKINEKTNLFLRIETTYRFVNVDNPSEYIDIITYGDGVDPQDKAPGKAMTYGDKYALLKAYKIETGDDPDQNASGDMRQKTKPVAESEKPTADQLKRLIDLKIDIAKVATYCKCPVSELTKKDVERAIQLKEKALMKQAAVNDTYKEDKPNE